MKTSLAGTAKEIGSAGNYLKALAHLTPQLNALKEAISDFSPVHKDEEDTWGWGKTGVYTARQGYLQVQSKKDSPYLK